MIKDVFQYELTRYWARRFREDAAKLREEGGTTYRNLTDVPPELIRVIIDAAESEAAILEAQLAEYDDRRARGGVP
jgi:hypothetical protein